MKKFIITIFILLLSLVHIASGLSGNMPVKIHTNNVATTTAHVQSLGGTVHHSKSFPANQVGDEQGVHHKVYATIPSHKEDELRRDSNYRGHEDYTKQKHGMNQ